MAAKAASTNKGASAAKPAAKKPARKAAAKKPAAAKKTTPAKKTTAAKKTAAAKKPARRTAAAKKTATAKKTPAKKPATRKAAAKKPAAKAKRTASLKLDPAPPPPKPVGPSAEQITAWRALSQEARHALREREAARVFAEAAEAHQKGDLEGAIQGYNKSLLLNPKVPDVYNNLGVALRATGKLEAAVACYRRSLTLKPGNASVFSNMGNALREMGRLQTAVACHQQAIKLAPNNPESFYNLGLVLRDLGDTDKALACFNKTLSVKADHVDCRWDRALTLLTKGDYVRGFEEYEWRWRLDRSPPRGFAQPQWDGAEIKGKTLLVHQEQGFGDLIHFARYLPMVKEKSKAGTLIVEVQPELARLFSTIDGVDKVVDKGSELPKFDFFVPIMSLAHLFETVVATIPADVPYLKAAEMETLKLPPSLENQRKIGIAWAGRPTHQNDANRSCDFTHFVELLGVPGVNVYSLQKGPREADIKEHGCDSLVMNLGPRLKDFADTAAVLEQLDLVITVDTAVAHLAGALARKVWVVMPFAADWRWLLNTESSPWYPTLRIFRQPRPGAWEPVFAEVRKALREELDLKPVSSVVI